MTHLSPKSPGSPPGLPPWDRRDVIKACAGVVLALSGCSEIFSQAKLGRLAINDPPADQFLPVLGALIPTILAFDHPAFPALTPATVQRRVLELFPFDRDPDAANVRRALTIFNATTLFPVVASPTVAEEQASNGDSRAAITTKTLREQTRYRAWLQASALAHPAWFVELSLAQRRSYLGLWGQSDFVSRRHFYQSAKRLVTVAAYTTPELWAAIGYAGPVLPGRS